MELRHPLLRAAAGGVVAAALAFAGAPTARAQDQDPHGTASAPPQAQAQAPATRARAAGHSRDSKKSRTLAAAAAPSPAAGHPPAPVAAADALALPDPAHALLPGPAAITRLAHLRTDPRIGGSATGAASAPAPGGLDPLRLPGLAAIAPVLGLLLGGAPRLWPVIAAADLVLAAAVGAAVGRLRSRPLASQRP